MNAEDNPTGRAIEEPGPNNVANTGLDRILIKPLVGPKESLGQTFGKLNPTPARGGLEYSSVRVPRGVIVDIIIHIDTQTRHAHPFDTSRWLVKEKVTDAEGADSLGY
jgi:hypothetical protein